MLSYVQKDVVVPGGNKRCNYLAVLLNVINPIHILHPYAFGNQKKFKLDGVCRCYHVTVKSKCAFIILFSNIVI